MVGALTAAGATGQLIFLPLLAPALADGGPGLVVYGLDRVATVPLTVALCHEVFGREKGTVVFGWVFASHQLGAAAAASAAGFLRTQLGDYLVAFLSAAALCAVAALITQGIRRPAVVPT